MAICSPNGGTSCLFSFSHIDIVNRRTRCETWCSSPRPSPRKWQFCFADLPWHSYGITGWEGECIFQIIINEVSYQISYNIRKRL